MRVSALLLCGLAAALVCWPATRAQAGITRPPPAYPTSTPVCPYCNGPPPPPTPVSTAPSKALPSARAPVVVQLSPLKVKPNQNMKLVIRAASGAKVTAALTYPSARDPKSSVHGGPYRGKVGSGGKWTRSWKVPASAGAGRGEARVDVSSGGKMYSTAVPFLVTK